MKETSPLLVINNDLRKAVLRWQISPDSKVIPDEINFHFARATKWKRGLDLTVNEMSLRVTPKATDAKVKVKAVEEGILVVSEEINTVFRPDEVKSIKII